MNMADIHKAIEAEIQRRPYAKLIKSKDPRVRFQALRNFYRAADREIQQAGRAEWGIDPYEVDWLNVFTHIERALWHDIRAADAVLYPQYPIGPFFVDFGNPVAKVAVECDGFAYHQDKAKDASRDEELRKLGWSVCRLTGSECIRDMNEETLEKSVPRQMVDRLMLSHGIGRCA
ncbi:DUF559 domain-containing protein [Ottowia sp. GY511]|uniref:Endonuclease domain-containing protein n=1 Tax=Ottowia flava TaxID=2675430 RepID=A0ABW4KP09_9BURK|nr:DUF559 domain-containing protein [Ottowia sp. GY511]TXK26516.1 DUF559 domain-containing protein [Ottowia sp. GY511]